jgi:hypothetical protein
MQSSKIDFISKFNDLVQYALSAAKEFPYNLCDYIVNECEFEAVVLLKVKDKSFELLGKSALAKKSLSFTSELGCKNCEALANPSSDIRLDVNPQCEFNATDIVINEGCLHISVTDDERVMLKIAKKTEFTNIDKDNIIVIGNTIRNLLRLWMGKKGGLSHSISEIVTTMDLNSEHQSTAY